ncbi:hypothetical protein WI460_09605 [Gemmatimonadota bacterium Y43]|uniref:hypothetical protein n=1 Tax=Gaopeijia maritima TaxID=3119007 RepID=UPI0032681D2E
MSGRAPMPFGWYVLSVVLQCAHVLGATVSQGVGNLAGIWGVTIPLIVGLLWGRSGPGKGNAVKQGFLVGFVPALIGLLLAVALGQVEPFLLVAGSASSGVAAVIGALIGNALAPKK